MRLLSTEPLVAGALLGLTIVSGYWLSSSGYPFNGALFNIHKLIALGAVIAAGVAVYHARAAADFSLLAWSTLAAALLAFLALFVTGALLSINLPAYPAALPVHRVTPYLALLGIAAAGYLLLGAR